MSLFNNKCINFVPSDIIKYVYKNWNGYLSSAHWGLYPNDKTPEMLILEYKKIKFYKYTNFSSYKMYFNPYTKNQTYSEFSSMIIESRYQAAHIFDFDTYREYFVYFENAKNLEKTIKFFKFILKQKCKEIDTENCDRFYNFD